MDFFERTESLQNDEKEFRVILLVSNQPSRIVIFAAGRGGSPTRHLPLLRTIAQQGCTVIAPHFEMLTSLTPEKEELGVRISQLEMVLRHYSSIDQPLIGIGTR